jgi:hypothetical protein
MHIIKIILMEADGFDCLDDDVKKAVLNRLCK